MIKPKPTQLSPSFLPIRRTARYTKTVGFVVAICISWSANFVAAQDDTKPAWSQFRGPDGNGVVEKIEHPLEWSAEKNVAWAVEVPGGGWSSPVVNGDRIFLTTATGPIKPVGFAEGVRNMRSTKPATPLKFQVVCLNLKDGQTVWTTTLTEELPEHGIHPSNSFATASPVTDGKHIFVSFASIGLVAALDLDGKEVWKKNIGAYKTGNGFGPGSSLAVHENHVFVQCDNDEKSFMVAFDKTSGDEAWRKDRDGGTSWATPMVWKNAKRTELIACGSGFVRSYDPKSGEENWTMKGMGGSFSASPAADKDRIYFGNSGPMSSGPLVSIDSEMSGQHTFTPDSSFDGMAWAQMRSGPGMTSPVSVGGFVYVSGRGTISCFGAEDGEQVFKERISGVKSAAASLWADNQHVFMLDETGQTFVMKVGKEHEVVRVNKIDDLFWSTPSVAGDSLLLRGVKKLYCIRK